eukprot:jgi/Tetstr1/445847/TSEL_033487.t1
MDSSDGWQTAGGRRKQRSAPPPEHTTAGATAALLVAAVPSEETSLPGWDAGWRTAGTQGAGGRKARRRGRQAQQRGPDWQQAALQDARREVSDSAMYRNLCGALRSAGSGEGVEPATMAPERSEQLVVYGLGSLEAGNVTPRYQLALATLLAQQHLPALRLPPQLYDPVFTRDDRELLHSLGCDVIGEDEGGARAVGRTPTLFYLPHCEAKLCNALLGANWRPDALSRMAVLGNSFATIAGRWQFSSAAPVGQPRPDRVIQCVSQELVVEIPVSDAGFAVPSAFNDMSLHLFPHANLAAAAPDTWQ